MSNSTTNLDLISVSQANKEVTANALLDAASPAMLYGRRAVTTAALTWGYYGGTVSIGGAPTQIGNGTVTLAASTTNYVEADPATGAVSVNQTGFTSGHTPLYTVVTGASTVSSYTDLRVLGGGGGSGTVKSVNTKAPDGAGAVTLTADDVGADASGAASSAVATHEAAADPHPQYLTPEEGDARYAPATAATGVSSVNGHTGTVTLGASDVGAVATSALGAANGAASLDSGGKLLTSQLPDLAIIDYLGTVANQSAMLTLTGQKGDWAIRSDNGKVYVITGTDSTSTGSWTPLSYPTSTGGTVTSIDLAVPGLLYTVSGNPVTTSGTLTFSLKTQGANTFLAGPTSGAAATPTMRAIVAADLPVMVGSGASHAPGAVPDPGATAGTTRFLREDGTWAAPASGGGSLTNWTESLNSTGTNSTKPLVALAVTNAASAVDAAIIPKGGGSLSAAIADGAATGGNKRGAYAVDWQMQRTAANQVASGGNAVISGGANNLASGTNATVAGGISNQATGGASFTVGESNTASWSWSVAAGYGSTSSKEASVAMGYSCIADAHYAVATGYKSSTRGIQGARAHAAYTFTSGYDCQEIQVILNGETSGSTPKVLTANGSQLTIKTNSSMTIKGLVVSRNESNGDTKSWSFEASLKSISGTVSLVAPCTPTVIAADSGASSWSLSVTADNTNKALSVAFTGPGGYWVATVATLTAVEYSQ